MNESERNETSEFGFEHPTGSRGDSESEGFGGFNLAAIHEAIEAVVPERPCIIWGELSFSYADIGARSRQLANLLIGHGLGTVTARSRLMPHQSGQDHLAIYLHNSNEYMETMLGAFKARVVPFNVNYRYVAEELKYLLSDSGARGIVFHSEFAPTLEQIRGDLTGLDVLLQVQDDSGNDLLPGAQWYDEVLDRQPAVLSETLRQSWSGNDVYMLYTGGTTGAPKGVIWKQADIFMAAMGGRRLDTNTPWGSLEEISAHATRGGTRVLPASPLMHGAAHWLAFVAFTNANTIVLPADTTNFDPVDVLDTIESLDVNVLLIVGDAFGRPIVEELEEHPRFADSLLVIVSGGALLSAGVKSRLVDALPNVMVLDGLGASETGTQASQLTAAGQVAASGTFTPIDGLAVLSKDRHRILEPGEDELGWLAQRGHIPLGYLGDPERTADRFVKIGGISYALAGDRAIFRPDGRIELRGRESSVINSGGEKIFAEEVEHALLAHPHVRDCVVTARPSQRWGQEVVALIQMTATSGATDEEIVEQASGSIARFKLPKRVIRVDRVERSAAGKPDYSWARRVATEASDTEP